MLEKKELVELLNNFIHFRHGYQSNGFVNNEGSLQKYSIDIAKNNLNSVQIPNEKFCLEKEYKSYQSIVTVFFKFASHCLLKDIYASKGMIRDENLKLIGFTYFNRKLFSNYLKLNVYSDRKDERFDFDEFSKEIIDFKLLLFKKVININIRSSYCHNKGILKLIKFFSENSIPFTILPDNEFETKYKYLAIAETIN